MKRIIDIPKELAEKEHWYTDEEMWTVIKAAQNGTPIPDNVTNGDVIKAIFPDAEIHFNENDVFFHHIGFWIKCNIRWWNAPYQKGGKE